MNTFGKLGPSAEAFLQSLADAACSIGVADRGLWPGIAMLYLSRALVRGHGIMPRHYYQSIAKSAGNDFRDGAVAPLKKILDTFRCRVCVFLRGFCFVALLRL